MSATDIAKNEYSGGTNMYCLVRNGTFNPSDFEYPGAGQYMTFRAAAQEGNYQLYVTTMETPNETGLCRQVIDPLIAFTSVQKPVFIRNIGLIGLTFFFAKRGNISGLWYFDTAVSDPMLAPPITCTTLDHVLNQCGKCAFLGDHQSCRGLSCGIDRVYDGCGRCVMYNQTSLEGYYDQCVCEFNTAFTLSTEGLGLYRFNDMETAIRNCLSRNIRLQSIAPTVSSLLTVKPRGLKFSGGMADGSRPSLGICLKVEAGVRGLAFSHVLVRGCTPTCYSEYIVGGVLLSGLVNVTDTEIDLQQCTGMIGLELRGRSNIMVTRNIVTGTVGAVSTDHAFSFTFSQCASLVTTSKYGTNMLNFTFNVVYGVPNGLVYADGLMNAWVTDNKCELCGGAQVDTVFIGACNEIALRTVPWFEIARNRITTNSISTADTHTTFRFVYIRDHNVYANIGEGKKHCMIFSLTESTEMRGLPPQELPWGYVLGSNETDMARHIAYENERCRGTDADIVYRNGECDDLCGMDEVANLGFVATTKQSPEVVKFNVHGLEVVPFELTTGVIHLENGYGSMLREKSTIILKMDMDNVSPGLLLVPFDLQKIGAGDNLCQPELLDRELRCKQIYPMSVYTGAQAPALAMPLAPEIVGDIAPLAYIYMNGLSRLAFNTPHIPFEWFRIPAYKTRIYGSRATIYNDRQLTNAYDGVAVIEDGTRITISVRIDSITPELPQDRTHWHEMEIIRVVACFPNASSEAAVTNYFGIGWRTGPVDRYYPGRRARSSGCWSQGFGMNGPFVVYDRRLGSQHPNFNIFQPEVFRNPSQLISEHNIEFNVIVTDDVPYEVQMSFTVEYAILRRKFLARVEYQWQEWDNITYINQVDVYRKCPQTRPYKVDADNDGLFLCEMLLPPAPRPKPFDATLYIVIAAIWLMCTLGLITVSLRKNMYSSKSPLKPLYEDKEY